MSDFIGVFENALTKEYCKTVIDHFNNIQTIHRLDNENVSPLEKDNQVYFLRKETDKTIINSNDFILAGFIEQLGKCFNEYKKKFSILTDGTKPYDLNNDIKIQKTLPGQGYHIWHCEAADLLSSRRLLLVFMYLNTCKEGGETEFLYQHKRIKPKAGTIVIAPAAWTHTHRGNPPLSGEKYMINGWLEFKE
tara:strand:- start:1 stop:576 length:576 start_codon:yes stop_codon:yes gene_type:complete